MQGSLDLPPIVIRSSRTNAALMLLISAGFVAAGAFIILRDPGHSPALAWLATGFFGLGVPVFAMRLLRPDRLRLAPDGITWRSVFRTSAFKWDDVRGFRAFSPTAGVTQSKHLGFDFTASYRGHGSGFRQTAKTMTGVEGTFGGGWEMSAAELAELLNEARTRWVTRGG